MRKSWKWGAGEFLPPDVEMATDVVPPQEEMRENAEQAEALAAPRPAAAAEEQSAPTRAAKRAAEASTTEPKRRRKDPKATAVPKTEAREYKVGDFVKGISNKDGREMDGRVESKEENGYYRVWVEELGETIRRKLPQRAASN